MLGPFGQHRMVWGVKEVTHSPAEKMSFLLLIKHPFEIKKSLAAK